MTAYVQSPASLLLASTRLASDNETTMIMPESGQGWSGQGWLDWDKVFAMAAAHGMRPLLFRFLQRKSQAHVAASLRGFDESSEAKQSVQFARAPSSENVRQAASLSGASRVGSFRKQRQAGSLSDAAHCAFHYLRASQSDVNDPFELGTIPDHVTATLQEFTRQNLRKNLWLTGELIRLLRLFAEIGVNVIPFKGPTLAALAYGDLGLREFIDLDLLISKTDYVKAQESLIAEGYHPEVLLNASQAAAFVRSCNVMAFWHPQKEIAVELHWELSPKYLPFSPDHDELRQRLIASYPGGQAVMTLSLEDLLVYLCAHGAKHFWERLSWITDVAGLIQRHSNLDWSRVHYLAVEQRCERVLLLGLRLARDVAGVALPAPVEELVKSDSESERLAVKITQWLFRDSGLPPGLGARTLFIVRLQRRWADKIRSFAQMAITPSAADWTSFPSLQRIAWAYPLLRPLRLMSKLVRGAR